LNKLSESTRRGGDKEKKLAEDNRGVVRWKDKEDGMKEEIP
jgi:hypothetical protein